MIVLKLHENKQENNETYSKTLGEIDKKIERLEERYIDEEIDNELYTKFLAKYKQERKATESEFQNADIEVSNLDDFIEKSVQLSFQLTDLWEDSDYNRKQKLQRLVFPEGIYYDKKNNECRTPRVNSVFLNFLEISKHSDKNKTGFDNNFIANSGSVARTRIEWRRIGLHADLHLATSALVIL